MDLLRAIVSFFGKLASGTLFTNHQDPLIIEQKALEKWHEPTIAFENLLEIKNPSLPLLQATCFLWVESSAKQQSEAHITLLRDIVQRLPVHTRASTLASANNNDFTRIVPLLIYLKPYRLEGFNDLAAAIQHTWDLEGKNDDLCSPKMEPRKSRIPFEEGTCCCHRFTKTASVCRKCYCGWAQSSRLRCARVGGHGGISCARTNC